MESKTPIDNPELLSQDKLESGDAKQKPKRRSKNTDDGRNFTCGCGKSYLSYPALYTHIKIKHNGAPPVSNSLPQDSKKPGRGRPKKEQNTVKHQREEPEQEIVDLSDCLNDLIQFLNDLSPKIEYEGQTLAKEQNSLVTKEMEVDALRDFPIDLFKGKEQDFQSVYDNLKQLQARRDNYEEPFNSQTELKLTPINRIIAIFILEVSQHLRKEFYREFVYFVLMYRRALNNIRWETKASFLQRPRIRENTEFCATENGEYIPEISNDFITELLPEYLKEYDLTGFKVIGQEELKMRNVVILTLHFCNWLNYHKYTLSRLVLNQEELS